MISSAAVLSDIHPFNTIVGGSIAGFSGGDVTKGIPYVVNLTHQLSEYVAGFRASGLAILDCVEVRISESTLPVFPSYAVLPEATKQAFLDTPYLLIWRVEREP